MIAINQLLRLLGPDTRRLLACYRGESPLAVIRRAVKLLAIADHHLAPNGRVLTGNPTERTRR